ncbi:MAG: hypothetical protein QXQ80_00205 [Nitrososphaerota archaeon]
MGSKLSEENVEVIKVELPKWLAEKFRRYVAEKYGFRRGALSKAFIDNLAKKPNTLNSLIFAIK